MSTIAPTTLKECVDLVIAEGAGVGTIIVVQPKDMLGILDDFMTGDPASMALFSAVSNALAGINAMPRRAPALCASCPRRLRKGQFALGLFKPNCDKPTSMLAFAVCHHCATDVDAIRAKAVVGLRRIWPELKTVTITHADGGRA